MKNKKLQNVNFIGIFLKVDKIQRVFLPWSKEIVERRHEEPIKFLFLPKMGLLGSQAGNEKKMLVVNYEQLLRAVFSCFHGQKLN